MHKGSCLCGAVRFEVASALRPVEGCHCSMCRKWTGHFLASTEVPRTALTIHGADKLTWFSSSEKARRGFCATCGSTLFFDPLDQVKHTSLGIAMGAFDRPTDTRMGMHIFVADKGDYYELTDGVPQNAA